MRRKKLVGRTHSPKKTTPRTAAPTTSDSPKFKSPLRGTGDDPTSSRGEPLQKISQRPSRRKPNSTLSMIRVGDGRMASTMAKGTTPNGVILKRSLPVDIYRTTTSAGALVRAPKFITWFTFKAYLVRSVSPESMTLPPLLVVPSFEVIETPVPPDEVR